MLSAGLFLCPSAGPFPLSYLQGGTLPQPCFFLAVPSLLFLQALLTPHRHTSIPVLLCLYPLLLPADLNRSGYFNPEVLLWRDGQPEWKPLKDLPELAESLAQAAPAAAAGEAVVAAEAAVDGMEEQQGADGNGDAAAAGQTQQPKTKAGERCAEGPRRA